MTGATTTCIAVLLFLTPVLMAQQGNQASKAPNSAFPADVIPAQQLIEWSWMQDPRPIPQTAPSATDRAAEPSVPPTAAPDRGTEQAPAREEAPRSTVVPENR
jgi:hypothetical protein